MLQITSFVDFVSIKSEELRNKRTFENFKFNFEFV